MSIEKRAFSLFEVRLLARGKKNPPDDDDQDQQNDDDEDEEDEEDRSIMDGYASVFNSDSEDLGGFVEQIAPGAFTRSMSEINAGKLNVVALWSHRMDDPPIGSTRSGTLKLSTDDKGLKVELDTSRMTPQQYEAIRCGDIAKMSFGFYVTDDEITERDDGTLLRTIRDVDLLEVSPVLIPAYPDTSAALRSIEAWRARQAPQAKYFATTRKLESLKAYLDRKLNEKGD